MPACLHIPTQYQSRFALLTEFCAEVASEARELGMEVNPAPGSAAAMGGPHVFVLFNSIKSAEYMAAWIRPFGEAAALLHWLVDHPLMLDAPLIDVLASSHRGYRLLTVCPDDTHWLQFRWPGLAHMTMPHGVRPSAIADRATLEASHATTNAATGGRDVGILMSGWIHTRRELEDLRSQVPESLRAPCDVLARLRIDHPELSFGQAFEIAMPPGLRSSNHWLWLSGIMRYTVAVVNRERRLRIVAALRGLPVTLLGGEAWREVESDTTCYAGTCNYADLHTWFKRARVGLALNPTQFVTGWSERLLLSLAGGAATLTDRRVLVDRDFGGTGSPMLDAFEIDEPESMRAKAEALLASPEVRVSMAHHAIPEVATKHLWRHRLRKILERAGIETKTSEPLAQARGG
jgi:hypothetical protein